MTGLHHGNDKRHSPHTSKIITDARSTAASEAVCNYSPVLSVQRDTNETICFADATNCALLEQAEIKGSAKDLAAVN